MSEDNKTLLQNYLQLPNHLEDAIAGLSEADLDLCNDGWTIRQIVHHLAEGEYIWQLNLRVIIGLDGSAFPFTWYFELSQDEWVKRWAYAKRPLGPSLALLRANAWNLAELLRKVPDAWDHFGRVTWPGEEEESHMTVREIVEMYLRHMDQHIEEIKAIRAAHQI